MAGRCKPLLALPILVARPPLHTGRYDEVAHKHGNSVAEGHITYRISAQNSTAHRKLQALLMTVQ